MAVHDVLNLKNAIKFCNRVHDGDYNTKNRYQLLAEMEIVQYHLDVWLASQEEQSVSEIRLQTLPLHSLSSPLSMSWPRVV